MNDLFLTYLDVMKEVGICSRLLSQGVKTGEIRVKRESHSNLYSVVDAKAYLKKNPPKSYVHKPLPGRFNFDSFDPDEGLELQRLIHAHVRRVRENESSNR